MSVNHEHHRARLKEYSRKSGHAVEYNDGGAETEAQRIARGLPKGMTKKQIEYEKENYAREMAERKAREG